MPTKKPRDKELIRGLVGFGLALAVLIGIACAVGYAPSCTTYEEQGYKVCSQNEWGGKRLWHEPLVRPAGS